MYKKVISLICTKCTWHDIVKPSERPAYCPLCGNKIRIRPQHVDETNFTNMIKGKG